ncbi:MAG: four helix bundle protein [Nitrospirota bacterium]
MEKPHKKLEAWKTAIDVVLFVYKLADAFPPKEQYGLCTQVRRAAISIPSNIAEGAARQSKKEFAKFLHVAKGSLSELDTQFELARLLGYLSTSEWHTVNDKLTRVDRLISGLIRHLRTGK